ncbi:lipid ABC transporter permease/ATP-binding protein, partial [Kosakonia sp. H7A]
IVSYVGKRYRRISRGIQDGMGAMAQTAEQSLSAQQEVKVHGTQRHEIGRYQVLANRMLRLNMKVETTRATASATVQFLAALALAVIVFVATRESLAGRLNAGEFMALMSSMMAIIPSLRRLTSVQSAISRGVAAAERLFGILDLPSEQDTGTREV